MGLKEDTRAAFDQAKLDHQEAQNAWSANATDANKQKVEEAKKALDKAWKNAFLYWTRGDAPLI